MQKVCAKFFKKMKPTLGKNRDKQSRIRKTGDDKL